MWNGSINELILFRHCEDYCDSTGAIEGSRLLLKLHLFKKNKIKVMFEITRIDHEKHEIEFCYDKQNITKGKQLITFTNIGGITVVNHETYYKSDSKLRDKIYPKFHNLCIDEFHSSVHASLLNDNEPEIFY
ncbi:MAG: hypothetical protein R2780_07820 [Crocinitomicaceae bacterium]